MPAPLPPMTIDRLLGRLADPTLTAEAAEEIMADLDGHEVEAALPAFRRLHDTADPAVLHAMSRLLARWARRPVGRALVPALDALLAEPAVGDLNKLAAAGLLETHGQPVDYPRLMGRLRDLGAVADEMRAAVLAASVRPGAAANVVERLGRLPTAALQAWIDGLRTSRDARALAILGPLSWAADPDIAVAAIAAIEAHAAVGPAAEAAGVALALAAAAHADPAVRRQAALTARRRDDDDAAADPEAAAAAVLVAAADRTAVDVYASGGASAGARLALVVWPDPARPGAFDVLTLHIAGGHGIQQYALVEGVSAGEMADLMRRLADGGMRVRRLAAPSAVRLLVRATADTLAHGEAAGIGFAVWPQAWLAD